LSEERRKKEMEKVNLFVKFFLKVSKGLRDTITCEDRVNIKSFVYTPNNLINTNSYLQEITVKRIQIMMFALPARLNSKFWRKNFQNDFHSNLLLLKLN